MKLSDMLLKDSGPFINCLLEALRSMGIEMLGAPRWMDDKYGGALAAWGVMGVVVAHDYRLMVTVNDAEPGDFIKECVGQFKWQMANPPAGAPWGE